MTVKELIALLQTMPPDALVIQTYCSDYADLEVRDFELMEGAKDFADNGCGLARHHGHLMDVHKKWFDNPESYQATSEYYPKKHEVRFVTALHIKGK